MGHPIPLPLTDNTNPPTTGTIQLNANMPGRQQRGLMDGTQPTSSFSPFVIPDIISIVLHFNRDSLCFYGHQRIVLPAAPTVRLSLSPIDFCHCHLLQYYPVLPLTTTTTAVIVKMSPAVHRKGCRGSRGRERGRSQRELIENRLLQASAIPIVCWASNRADHQSLPYPRL